MNESNQNFLDSKTIMAVVLVFLSWLGWQQYMQSKYPKKSETAAKIEGTNKAKILEAVQTTQTSAPQLAPTSKQEAPVAQNPEQKLSYGSEYLNFDISSKGMGISNITLGKYKERSGSIKRLGGDGNTFQVGLISSDKSIEYKIERKSDSVFVGTGEVDGTKFEETVTVDPQNYSLKTTITVISPKESFRGVAVTLADRVVPAEKRGLFLPAMDHQEFYLVSDGKSQRLPIVADKGLNESHSKESVVTLGSQYFVQGFVNRSNIFPDAEVQSNGAEKTAEAIVKYQILNHGADFNVNYVAYVGPKSLSLLKGIDEDLAGVINFGIFGFIGVHILKLMILFHEWIGNWGLAIILLTVLVRAIVLPFNVMSYKSMKSMQTIQPLLKQVREKYKDDSQKLSMETMNIMRTHKVNPLGGCLPVLLQLPIFWALYQVLGQSIELYQAPFGLWIHDLSMKDPLYVLPVLMGVTLFLQQQMTPNSMDPAQRKVLMFMPLLFSFFMISLPSGLTLYIFVSGLFGVTQQYYFMRNRKTKLA